LRLEASTKSPIHNLIHEFLINMAFRMAYPNFKKGLKMASGPLGVNPLGVNLPHEVAHLKVNSADALSKLEVWCGCKFKSYLMQFFYRCVELGQKAYDKVFCETS
jgi:hypothetical protein